MRISDWSSDVCSSYLFGARENARSGKADRGPPGDDPGLLSAWAPPGAGATGTQCRRLWRDACPRGACGPQAAARRRPHLAERTRCGTGTMVLVIVVLGGRHNIINTK